MRSSTMTRVTMATAPRSGRRRCCNATWRGFTRSQPRARALAGRSPGWASTGSAHATGSDFAPTPGARPRGAQKRSERPRANRAADARRDDPHRDAAVVLLLRSGRPAGVGADQRRPQAAHLARGAQCGDRGCPIAGDPGLDAGGTPALPQHDPGALAGLEHRAVRGPGGPAHGATKSPDGEAVWLGGPLVAPRDTRVERDGYAVEASEAGGAGGPADGKYRPVRRERL